MILLQCNQENYLTGNASLSLRYPTYCWFLLSSPSQISPAATAWLRFLYNSRLRGGTPYYHFNRSVLLRYANGDLDFSKRAVDQNFETYFSGGQQSFGLPGNAGVLPFRGTS